MTVSASRRGATAALRAPAAVRGAGTQRRSRGAVPADGPSRPTIGAASLPAAVHDVTGWAGASEASASSGVQSESQDGRATIAISAAGRKPRLRADRRVAYPRPADGSDAPPHRRAAARGRARARRRARRGAGRPRAPRSPPRCASRAAARARSRSTSTAGGRSTRSRADTARTPASVEKLYTTSAALTLYGVDGHLTTQRARRRRRRPGRRADRQPLPARRRRPQLRRAPGGRARGRARARQRPARDHGPRDRRRVRLRLAARPAVRGLSHDERGRAAERADLQPRPHRRAPPVLAEGRRRCSPPAPSRARSSAATS